MGHYSCSSHRSIRFIRICTRPLRAPQPLEEWGTTRRNSNVSFSAKVLGHVAGRHAAQHRRELECVPRPSANQDDAWVPLAAIQRLPFFGCRVWSGFGSLGVNPCASTCVGTCSRTVVSPIGCLAICYAGQWTQEEVLICSHRVQASLAASRGNGRRCRPPATG